MIVTMGRGEQSLTAGDRELEDGDAAGRVVAREQEADGERPGPDRFISGVDGECDGLGGHGRAPGVNVIYVPLSLHRK
jgi:hypothetical protein